MRPATDDVVRRLCGVLGIAGKTVTVLLDGEPASEGDGEPRPEKVLAETALLLLFAGRTDESHAEVHERVDDLARRLVPHARSERVLAGITFAPALAREYAIAHACLSRLGHPDEELDRALAASLASASVRTRERVPYRQLELEWLGSVWEACAVGKADDGLGARTTAATGLDAFSAAREDVYAFTHSLIYLTDFGRRLDRLPRDREALLADAEAALARSLDDDDFDVAGELLLAWPLLAVEWSPAASFGWGVLARVEDEVGYLPSLSLSEERYRELEGLTRTRYTVGEAYHTVYVMGLLCAALLQSGGPAGLEASAPSPGSGSALLGELIPKECEPQWLLDAAGLDPSDLDELATFLATAGLHRAVTAGDLGRVRAILALCVEHDLPHSPSLLQAAELLQRVATSPYAAALPERV
jgi:hypothetical protein